MKLLYTLVFATLLWPGYQASAQGLTPSTVRQVFALDKGDSLVYHIWTTAQICSTVCNTYKLRIVDTVYHNAGGDSIFIQFRSRELYFDSAGCINNYGHCYHDVYGGVAENRYTYDDRLWSITDLDSSVINVYKSRNQHLIAVSDSQNSDALKYNGSRQITINWAGMLFDGGVQAYADSIGIVYNTLSNEAPNIQNEELIYYHKSNGKIWGDRRLNVGIHDISPAPQISIYPNPATGTFMISSDHYRDVTCDLYDIIGAKVMSLSLDNNETAVNSHLPSGIYQLRFTQDYQLLYIARIVIE